MILNPGQQFERMKQNPRILVPLIIVSLMFLVSMSMAAISMDIQVLMGTQGTEGISEAEWEGMLLFTRIFMVIWGIVTAVLMVFIYSVLHLIVTKIAGSSVTFKQLFSMNTFIIFIGAIGALLNYGIVMAIGGNSLFLMTSLAGVLNSDNMLLNSIELFAIWQMLLVGLGLHKVAGLSKGVAYTTAIVIYVIGLLIGNLGYLLGAL